MIAKIICLLLLIIVGLLCYIIYKIRSAFHFLSDQRLQSYLSVLEYYHDCSHQLRKDGRISHTESPLTKEFNEGIKKVNLIGSYKTADKSDKVLSAMIHWHRTVKNEDSETEITAAEDATNRALNELWHSMRSDLKIVHGEGKIPSLEIFTARQKTRPH